MRFKVITGELHTPLQFGAYCNQVIIINLPYILRHKHLCGYAFSATNPFITFNYAHFADYPKFLAETKLMATLFYAQILSSALR